MARARRGTTDVLPHALEPEIGIRVERGAMEMKQAIESTAPQEPIIEEAAPRPSLRT
ncbi:hypothetical protein [Actinoallomurus sp. NPDC052274]|uniref:hypothetical protein n=1 Tax=Actinoallomurus sp. NPDC052274 TaxID=3155420 RepID=UPI00342CD3E9